MRGLLIAVCGLDGSGKTTQIKMLEEWFVKNNLSVLLTRQPTDYYRQDNRVRQYLDSGECPDMQAIALLAAADRRWHMKTCVEPSINEGTNIITDRYLYSSLAYFKVRGLEPEYIKAINGDIRTPDVTVFLDLEPEITLKRVKNRDGKLTKYEERDPDMFRNIRAAFKQVLPNEALILDATQKPTDIHQLIIKEVENKLKLIEEVELYETR
ncbi:dTMP kinase [Bacillus solimangrovi]|uniref:Thymidylate kinase n=1 Tax=Bacillus solimangrovi TaxID=1305675 RepID=A0A1E5LJM4_9BACI|nr:dTMP kinase [Bacillus solimangrovi]OEH94287.1 dTMP kinase [Bacillus solimangrovi]